VYDLADLAGNCRSKLTVYGAFVSNDVEMQRVVGSEGFGEITPESTVNVSGPPTVTNLADSGDSSLQDVKWIGLQETPTYIAEMENWGTCGSRPRSFPYLPDQNIYNYTNGFCSLATADVDSDAGNGASFRADAFGGWSSPGSSYNASVSGFTPGGAGVAGSGKLNACTYNGNSLARIWGSVPPTFRDPLFPSANWDGRSQDSLYENNGVSTPVGVYKSNGYALVRHAFTLSQENYDLLQQAGSQLNLFAIADDWSKVFINGQEAVTQYNTVTPSSTIVSKNLLVVGENVIAIQAVDKARNYNRAVVRPSGFPPAQAGWGLCYDLSIENDGNITVTTPPQLEESTSNNISEVFIFSPELYLALLSEGSISNSGKFDSLLSLPPAF
jgi:hypothetical protein